MAWTSPRTWVSGEVPSGATFNTHVRDNFKAIGDAWTAYTPTFTGTGTAPAIGNGTITGRYLSIGKLVIGSIEVVFGSTSTYGDGFFVFSLPVATRVASSTYINIGTAIAQDASAAPIGGYDIQMRQRTTTTFDLWRNGVGVSAGAPFTFTTSDGIRGHFMYEAA